MNETDLHVESTSLPLLQAFVQRQTRLLDVYRSALEQFSAQSAGSQNAGIRAALTKIDTLQASHEALKAQLAALQTDFAASEIQRERASQNVIRLAPIQTLYDALVSNGILRESTAEGITEIVEQFLHRQDIERQFNDALVYISSLEESLRRKDNELIAQQQALAYVQNSISYRLFVRPIWKVRRIVLPDGSRRANGYFRARAAVRRLLQRRQRPAPPATVNHPPAPAAVEPPAQLSSVQPQRQIRPGPAAAEHAKSRPPALSIPRGSDVVFTIASKNYLATARALLRSITAVHPEVSVVTVLVDEIDGYFDPAAEPFQTLLAADLGIPRWPHFSMKYDIMELNTAVKPYAIQYLIEKFDARRVIYFDPDILVFNRLDRIFDLLEGHLCVLTPHITSPLNDDFVPSEIDFLKVGTYNLGFFAISQKGDWRGLLLWWQDRLYENCTREVERGLFVDQHWMDLVPSLFAPVYLLRDAGYNVAYWNLTHRQLTVSADGRYMVNDAPLVFFHYSGFSVTQPEAVSKHQNRFRFDSLTTATRACYLDYRQRLLDNGYEQARTYPYAYGHFDNGVPITDLLRICLRTHDSRGERWPDPYRLDSSDCFLSWAATPGAVPPFRYLSPYALALYERRPDLIASFPNLHGRDEIGFATWFAQQRTPADIFAPAFVDPVRYALESGGGAASSNLSGHVVPSRRQRAARALRYFRAYPTQVKPYVPPEALTDPSAQFTGPTNTYGRVRNTLRRVGMLRAVKRAAGLRLVMTAREYFDVAPMMRDEPERRSLISPHGPGPVSERVSDITCGITIVGYLRTESGIGQIARNLVACLRSAGFPTAGYVLNAGDVYREQDQTTHELAGQENHFIQLFNVNADQAGVIREFLGEGFYRNHYNIGYWFWELSDFPLLWQSAFDIYDEIWVATKFVQAGIQAVSPKPVLCMPPAITVDLPEASSRARFGLNDDEFVVLFVFDALSVVERKNPWAVIRAFQLAFTDEERRSDVRLVIKVTNLRHAPESDRLRSEVANVNGILIDGYLDRLEVNALIHHCDVYISLHRSEGYGLTMAEAMYLGKPVIATAYSGNADFMNETNSYPVPYELIQLGRLHPPYEAHHVWADPDIETAARYLRDIYDHPESANAKGEEAARYMRKHYSLEARGAFIAARLNEILDNHFISRTGVDDRG